MDNKRIERILHAPPEVQHAIDLILDGKVRTCGHTRAEGPLLLRMGAAAKYLGVSRATFWRMIRDGILEKVEFMPGSYRIRRSDLDAIATGKVEGAK